MVDGAYTETLEALLRRFDDARQNGVYGYDRVHYYDGGAHDFHVVVGAVVHGDEVGSLPAVVALVEGLNAGDLQYGGRLSVFLGNPEASAANTRFLEADLNRVFIDEPPACHEGDRAQELKPILANADVFLDLHQTILDTDRAFYIFPFDTEGWRWARAIGGAQTWVTRRATESFSAGTCCADEYVRLHGKPGLTLELGPKGFSGAAEARAATAIAQLLRVADAAGADPAAVDVLAEGAPDLEFVQTTWRQSFDDPHMRLRPGLINFQHVTAGETISAKGTPEICVPDDGMVLFPKYPPYTASGEVVEPRPGDIVNFVQPLDVHPAQAWT